MINELAWSLIVSVQDGQRMCYSRLHWTALTWLLYFWVAFPVASILNQIFWSNSVCAIYSVCDMQRVNNGTKCSKHDVCNCLLERAKSILHSESLLFTRTYVYVCVVRVLYMLNTTYVRVLINLNYWKGHPYNKGRPHKGEGVYQKRRGVEGKCKIVKLKRIYWKNVQ